MAITITSVSVTTGYTVGGTISNVVGTNLDTCVGVYLGAFPAVIVSKTSTTLRFQSGPGTGSALPIRFLDGTTEVTATPTWTYTALSSPEHQTSTSTKKWRLDATTDGGTTWVKIRGITNLQPTVNTTTQDDSDYDSGVWGSDAKTQLKWELTGTVKRGKGDSTGLYDAGQEILRAAHDQVGSAGSVVVRWYDRTGGPEAFTGTAFVQWSEAGGAPDALSTASFTLGGQGARTLITNPVLADASLAS
jgi:hypothetical protein